MSYLATISRRCQLGRSGITRLVLVAAIVLWTVVFNMLSVNHSEPQAPAAGQAFTHPRQAFHGRPIVAAAVARESRRVSSVQQTVAVANPPPARDPVLMTQVREAVAATLREVAAPAAALQKAPPQPWKANNGHEPLSCFTDKSSTEQRSFNESEKAMFRYLYDWPEVPTSSCKRMIKFGGIAGGVGCLVDGDKFACLDPPLQLGKTKECLVYSFGINYDWSFDEAAEMFGCEVHSFDPSIDYPEGSRSPGITFHHIGIGRNNHTNVYGWKIYTLDQIVQMLGHENRTIHYMKMDAEGGEFDMLAQQLLDGNGDFVLDRVEQIGFEIHYRLDPRLEMDYYLTVNETVTYLRQLGFNLIKWEYNKVVWQRYMFPGVERPVSLLYEILLVKNGPDTWDRSTRGWREREVAARAEAEAAALAAAAQHNTK